MAARVLVHDMQPNSSRSNNARFMHKLYLSLHGKNKLTGEYSLHPIEELKILLNNTNRV